MPARAWPVKTLMMGCVVKSLKLGVFLLYGIAVFPGAGCGRYNQHPKVRVSRGSLKGFAMEGSQGIKKKKEKHTQEGKKKEKRTEKT